jgi:flagellar basal body-associated protein FliL
MLKNVKYVISGFNVLLLLKFSLNRNNHLKIKKMKKIKIPILFLALLFIGALAPQTLFALKPAAQKSSDIKQLNKLMKKLVKYPDFTLNDKEDGGEIYITFMLANDGQINVEKVTAPSKRLEEYVTKELSVVTANDLIHSNNQRYKVQFHFNYY